MDIKATPNNEEKELFPIFNTQENPKTTIGKNAKNTVGKVTPINP